MTSLASAISGILTEKRMLLFSLATLPGALFQLLVSLSPDEALILDLVDWTVISVFIIEYLSRLYLAPSRSRFVKANGSILSLSIILLAFGGVLAGTPLLYSAPLLRAMRATKLFTESGRSSIELGA